MLNYYTMTHGHLRPDLWAGRAGVPVMVVASNYLSETGRLRVRPFPTQCSPTFADCGGFAFAAKGRDYPFTHDAYIAWLSAMTPRYAATMDYPCTLAEDWSVLWCQSRTLAHASALLAQQHTWEWVPVLQGRTVAQYVRHAHMYQAAGLVRPYMGIGSLVGRTKAHEVTTIVRNISQVLPQARFHLFGVKLQILKQAGGLPETVTSVDSGAWNGNFGSDRDRWKAAQLRGLTQAQYEVWEALPRYKRAVEQAIGAPKQLSLLA